MKTHSVGHIFNYVLYLVQCQPQSSHVAVYVIPVPHPGSPPHHTSQSLNVDGPYIGDSGICKYPVIPAQLLHMAGTWCIDVLEMCKPVVSMSTAALTNLLQHPCWKVGDFQKWWMLAYSVERLHSPTCRLHLFSSAHLTMNYQFVEIWD